MVGYWLSCFALQWTYIWIGSLVVSWEDMILYDRNHRLMTLFP